MENLEQRKEVDHGTQRSLEDLAAKPLQQQ